MEFRWEIYLKCALTTLGLRIMPDCNKGILGFILVGMDTNYTPQNRIMVQKIDIKILLEIQI